MPTWDDILCNAVQCGLSIKEFWALTWREYQIHLKAAEEKQIMEVWQPARAISYMIYLSNTTEKHPKKIEEFWPLTSDEKPVPIREQFDIEQVKKSIERLNKINNG